MRARELAIWIGLLGLSACGNEGSGDTDMPGVMTDGSVSPDHDGGIFVPPPTCVDMATLPSWRKGMAIGEWKELTSANLSVVKPMVAPAGGYYGRIDAWNGIATDVTTSRLYLGGAGGHADYAGNEVYMLDLTVDAPQWVLQMEPSPMSAYTHDMPYYSDGRPSPTHTYYSVWFIEQRQKLFRFAGAAVWGSGNGGTDKIDSWDPMTKDWDPAGTNPNMTGSGSYEDPTAKDFVTGDVYQVALNNHLLRWNAQNNTVDDLGNAKGGGDSESELYASPSVVDTDKGRLIFFADIHNMGPRLRIYDLAAKTWTTPDATGPEAAAVTAKKSQAMAFYDYCAKKIFMKTNSAGAVYWIDPETLSASSFPTTGTAPPSPKNGVHTLFQSVPKLGGYAYQPTSDSKLYFLATQ